MKAKFGAIVVAGSGKIGGHVMSKNRGGAYMRTKVTPSNPNSTAQQASRALLGSLSTGWAGLTEAQRASFNNAVNDFSSTDIFGDIKNPSGINLYVKLNANLSNAGLPLLENAPTKQNVPFAALETAVMLLAASEISLAYATTDLVSVNCLFRACAPLSAGISNAKSKMRVIASLEGAAPSTTLYEAYVAKFGVPAAGSNIYFSVQPIIATGQAGVIQTVKLTVS